MARFTLLDDVYYDALLAARDALARQGVPSCVVGGGASQIWIASLVSGEGARRFVTEAVLPAMLRPTRDIDFSTRCEPGVALSILNELASHHRGAHVLGPRAMRLGPVVVSLTLEPADLAGMADRYDDLLDSRTNVVLRRGKQIDDIPVIGLCELIATKLTRRGDKAKDIVDVGNLLAAAARAGRRLDAGSVRAHLGDDADAERLLVDLFREAEEE